MPLRVKEELRTWRLNPLNPLRYCRRCSTSTRREPRTRSRTSRWRSPSPSGGGGGGSAALVAASRCDDTAMTGGPAAAAAGDATVGIDAHAVAPPQQGGVPHDLPPHHAGRNVGTAAVERTLGGAHARARGRAAVTLRARQCKGATRKRAVGVHTAQGDATMLNASRTSNATLRPSPRVTAAQSSFRAARRAAAAGTPPGYAASGGGGDGHTAGRRGLPVVAPNGACSHVSDT